MKMKQMILLVMSAVVVAFGASSALAQSVQDAVLGGIAIKSITKEVADGGEVNLPLSPETTSTIYFDVTLANVPGTSTVVITGNEYNDDLAPNENYNRPYLVLDIPLTGTNTKKTIAVSAEEAAADVAANRLVGQARAYYQGQADDDPWTLRFAYDVRPGDMTSEITWAKQTSGLVGAPSFGGKLSLIKVFAMTSTMFAPMETNIASSILHGYGLVTGGEYNAVPEDTERVWPVCGYTMTIGGMIENVGTQPTDDYGSGMLYQGLVPVTISTTGNVPAATPSSTHSKQCYFWVETKNTTSGEWEACAASTTSMNTLIGNATEIAEADWTEDATFGNGRCARFIPTTNATSFTPQTYFVNIPASIAAGTEVRLCYGVRNDGVANTKTLFASIETVVEESPISSLQRTSGYDVSCGEMDDEGANGKFTVNGITVNGGTINVAAGETVTLVVAKKNATNLINFGTLYADIKLISDEDEALANFSHRFIPLNPASQTSGFPIKLSITETAKGGESIYSIRIPRLAENDTPDQTPYATVDEPFYVRVISSPKRETITLGAGATGTAGVEYYQPLDIAATEPGSANFLEYKLSVSTTSESTRYFTLFPVADDMKTAISADATFVNGGQNVHAAMKKYVILQPQAGVPITREKYPLTVSIPPNATSVTFYAACINDYPYYQNILNGKILEPDATSPTGFVERAISGVNFIARSSNSSGVITGTNDVCNGTISPIVQNRAPTIRAGSAPTTGSTGTELPFNFTVVDVLSDYLIARLDYGDGNIDTQIHYHEASMVAIMGEDDPATPDILEGWPAELKKLMDQYGIDDDDVYSRPDNGFVNIHFKHAYNSTSPSWSFTVTDSSMLTAEMAGQLSLSSSQKFTFYTISDDTVPANGYVRWDNAPDKAWLFGSTYTYDSLKRSEGETSATVTAQGYPAGAANPNPDRYTEIDAERDSFFYKWSTYSDDYIALLPTGNDLYNNILTINRAFVSGGGEADDYTKWHDIVLKAIFVAEWRATDAREPFEKSKREPYLYELGDYNQDGVPDGWLLRNFGQEAGRPLAEGVRINATASEGTVVINEQTVGDIIPAANWNRGDAAYGWNGANRFTDYPEVGPGSPGPAFDYLARLRGRDLELNAADGHGEWLSIPRWYIYIHPVQDGGDAIDVSRWLPDPIALRVSPTGNHTANYIPYTAADAEGWAPVMDADGNPVTPASGYAYTIEVQTRAADAAYETCRYIPENGWGRMEGDTWVAGTGDFPSATINPVLNLDEPFTGTDPRNFSWLSRFPANNADVDGDGVPNGYEYYFWYYASRLAWAPTVTDADGNVQIIEAAWPRIDLKKIGHENTDENCMTVEKLVMGRRYLASYNPDAPTASFYENGGNANEGKGNYWEPIPVGYVLDAFDPYRNAGNADIDNDGLSNAEEILAGTNPIDCDTDNDWMPDGWESEFGLNPLVDDGNLNPDRDFYAVAELTKYTDYRLLIPVGSMTINEIIEVIDPTTGVTTQEWQETTGNFIVDSQGSPHYYYYDAEKNAFCTIVGTGTDANTYAPWDPMNILEDNQSLTYVEPEELTLGTDTRLSFVVDANTTWGDPVYMQIPGETVRLRDHDVYKALGFSQNRAWAEGIDPEQYTQEFNNREEFNSAVRAAGVAGVAQVITLSTNPTKADTNDDGIPDGWARYVDVAAVGPLSENDKDVDKDGVLTVDEFALSADWARKTHPSDPRNPDTDYDSVTDPAERSAGTCPTNIDTDGDGMVDGWEIKYKGKGDKVGAPNPLEAGDGDLDPDRDGLTNYQEYLVGLLRHLRYDLGPDAARIYKDFPGEIKVDGTTRTWKTLPEIYSAMDDLANPEKTYSIEYLNVQVDPLNQAFAEKGAYAPALVDAFNRRWNSTIIFPTDDQTADYGLSGDGDRDYMEALQETIIEFDAAYHRLLADKDANRAKRQLRALMTRIDYLIEELNAVATQEVVLDILTETKTLWEARRGQVVGAGALDPIDPAWDGIELPADIKAKIEYMYRDLADLTKPAQAYESALYVTKCPLLRTSYRAAVRGYNGGIHKNGCLAPIGHHRPVAPFAATNNNGTLSGGRLANAGDENIILLGVPVEENRMGVRQGNVFATTNPLVADTDADGMDDYWEVFHGLNPILGDYVNGGKTSSENPTGGDADSVAGSGGYTDNVIFDAYGDQIKLIPTGGFPFWAPELGTGDVTGFDYYTFPWLAGVPFADPDGDGLLNFEEAVNPVASDPAHYGTDPSPLWMTDKDNPNSFTARFYGLVNANAMAFNIPISGGGYPVYGRDLEILPKKPFTYVPTHVDSGEEPETNPSNGPMRTDGAFVLPFEINEGYDTDGDGIGDLTELTNTTIYRGNPQSLRTPDRQQSVYLGGFGALQSFGETQFGPTALTTFTLECWVKPDADQATDEVVLINRPWRFNDGAENDGHLRHNFTLGLKKSGNGFLPYVNYTGAGTSYENGQATAPQVAPTVTSGEMINAGEWNHVAASYDGKRLVIVVNGVETGAATCSLIPANGVIAIKNDSSDDYRRFTYRKAPIIIGATPASVWFAELGNKQNVDFNDRVSGQTAGAPYYDKCYKGYIDEVRIWNGARTASQIAESRRKSFTQPELLKFRYDAFMARYEGNGYYQANTPAEPLAIYTFNDLLGGARDTSVTPAVAADEPYERYPGEKLVGDKTVPGSFTYRRKGFEATLNDLPENGYITKATLPTATEIFSSYYTHQVADKLRSKLYCEGLDGEGFPYTEYVPLAHNTVAHLPVADVERVTDEEAVVDSLLAPSDQNEGSPSLRFPSGSPENLKLMDSVYWTPYAAGYQVNPTAMYNVKVDGNPYAYYLGATYTFDMLNYRVHRPYTIRTGTDLLVYGDAFAKYDFESWDNSPSTDPSAGQDDGTGGVGGKPNGSNWFEYKDVPAVGDLFTDIQYSEGSKWLEDYVAIGQTKDSDEDRMPNWWENYYGLDPEDPTGDNGPHGDNDGDFLTNYAEYLAKADPTKYSTVGNGVPDSQIPIWFRRGRPTFSVLYTDNDMMEDHWEAANRSDALTVDLNDAAGDPDGDGWSNFAEARAGFRGGKHSTNPNAITSISNAADGENVGKVVYELPTPALRMTVDYFGDQNVYTNALDDAQIVVHAYTAKNNNSAPDAVFALPMFTASGNSEPQECTQDIGNWARGVLSGYLHLGNVVPSSFIIRYARHFSEQDDSLPEGADTLKFDIIANTAIVNDVVELYCNMRTEVENEEGEEEEIITRISVGTLNCTTGYYELDFTDEKVWPDYGYTEDDNGTKSFYSTTEFVGEVAYKSVTVAGTSSTFTLAKAASGYLKEGKNNFFVFADLNSNGSWENGEPAGIPDQHDVEIGFDQVNRPLHVTLTTSAPPGAVRLDVKSILDQVMQPAVTEEEDGGDDYGYMLAASDDEEDEGNPSAVTNPTTGNPLDRDNFSALLDYELILTQNSVIAKEYEEALPPTVVYRKQYNAKKPYLTEDEIFSYSESGLPGTDAPAVKAMTYKVYYVPTNVADANGVDGWKDYNIAIVTNVMKVLDLDSTKLVSPVGGALRHNTELTFEWLCNVQVPTFTLTITKTADGSGTATNKKVYEKTVRGVNPVAMAPGNGIVEQYRYRYMLPRGIGEIAEDKTTVFGNGSYAYTLALNPYNGTPVELKGNFTIQLTSSGDATMTELPNTKQDTSYNTQDSNYLRARVRYNGVLAKDEDFAQRRIVIEAHYSGSFNGDPIASTSDFLVYDTLNDDGTFADALADDKKAELDFYTNLRNRCVRMVKDKIETKDLALPDPDDPNKTIVEEKEIFYSTRFDAEIRGFATKDPVYLIAYFDLNGNGKRDAWEPWGYAMQGLDARNGFYFDPRAVKPVSTGKDYQVEFYIQDVDTDNDKLADSWEWISSGRPTGDFADWCDTFGTTLADHHGRDIWVVADTSLGGGTLLSANATYGLTAYGAQLYGLTVTGTPDANGAVPVEELPADTALAAELYSILDDDVATALFEQGYISYGLTITNVAFDGEIVKLTWDVTSALGVDDGRNLTDVFKNNANTDVVYAVYGKTSIADTTWTKVGTVKVANGSVIEVPATVTIDGEEKPVSFFKVILSAFTPSETVED